jgi:uncharacterized membrane protein
LLDSRHRDLSKFRLELLGFVAAYTGALFSVLPRLSLWLDEIRDLIGVRSDGFAALLKYTAVKTAAGVPLGYAVQYTLVRMFGLSVFTGRLSSALFSIAACLGLAVLAGRLRIRHPLLPLIIFASFPLQLRYALEARPYSQALCLSIWCTVAFFKLLDRPGFSRAALYATCIAAGLYTQPYSFFVPVAHLGWIVLVRERAEKRRVLILTGLAVTVALLAFLPWVVYAVEHWQRTAVSEGDRFSFAWKSPLMIFKELVGAGYLGTAVLLIAVAAGMRAGRLQRDERLFWILYATVPVIAAVIADAVFNYYLAIRQMIFVLAPLALLASLSASQAFGRFVLPAALLAANAIADYQFFERPREDWRPAAERLSAEVARGACIVFVPSHTDSIYGYFKPGLESYACEFKSARTVTEVAAAFSHYATQEENVDARQRLSPDEFVKIDEQPGDPRVEVYRRR